MEPSPSRSSQQDFSIHVETEEEWEALILDPKQHLLMHTVSLTKYNAKSQINVQISRNPRQGEVVEHLIVSVWLTCLMTKLTHVVAQYMSLFPHKLMI